MRYPQLFATKAVRATLDAGRTKGVIWHTQGSGKTALSYFLTRFLRDYYQARNRATRFFFIVDRLDLADQAKAEFEARGAIVALANSRDDFARALKGAGEDTNAVSDERTPAHHGGEHPEVRRELRCRGFRLQLGCPTRLLRRRGASRLQKTAVRFSPISLRQTEKR